MTDSACKIPVNAGINEQAEKVRQHQPGPRTHNTYHGGEVMPLEHDIDDSGVEFKTCPKCNEEKTLSSFSPSSASKGGRRRICTQCRSFDNFLRKNPTAEEIDAYRKNYATRRARENDESLRWKHIRLKYGIRKSEYEAIERSQNGLCAICLTDSPGGRFDVLVVDHCHNTGEVRGLLCNKCNVALGMLGDTPEAIGRAFLHVIPGNPEHSSNWRSIGELAAELVRKAGAA